MAKKDSTILYHDQMAIVRKWLDAEQIGRLMIALFEFEEGGDPQVDDDIGMAFDFLTLQAKIDREKYEEKCRKNRENGAKGGAPKGNKNASKQPKQPNAKKNNPNENDNDNENENDNDNENENENDNDNENENDNDNENENENDNDNENEAAQDSIFHGSFSNVDLTAEEYNELVSTYERPKELINKVSRWLQDAKNDVPDHYGLCVKFATNDDWPKRKVIEPVRPIIVEDPLSEEEQERKVADMRARLNGAIKSM